MHQSQGGYLRCDPDGVFVSTAYASPLTFRLDEKVTIRNILLVMRLSSPPEFEPVRDTGCIPLVVASANRSPSCQIMSAAGFRDRTAPANKPSVGFHAVTALLT